MTFDMSESIAPKSDQVNADDLIAGPRTYTITSVTAGNPEQPVNIHLAETDRAYRPSKTMRRVIVSAWGPDASAYTGRRFTVYRDPEVTFGRDKVGGIKISHLSDIDKRLSLMLTATRGKRVNHTVDPLLAAPQPTNADRLTSLRAEWQNADPERRQVIEAEVAKLTAGGQ